VPPQRPSGPPFAPRSDLRVGNRNDRRNAPHDPHRAVIAIEVDYDQLADALANRLRELLRKEDSSGGFLDVDGAAAFISSTPTAVRSLVQRQEIPVHKAPNGRLLFDRDELEAWVRSG
jgi:hypothetical protein